MQREDHAKDCSGILAVALGGQQRADGKILIAAERGLVGATGGMIGCQKLLVQNLQQGCDAFLIGHENLLELKRLKESLEFGARNSAPESHQKAGGPLCSGVQTAQT